MKARTFLPYGHGPGADVSKVQLPTRDRMFYNHGERDVIVSSASITEHYFILTRAKAFTAGDPLNGITFSRRVTIRFKDPEIVTRASPRRTVVVITFFRKDCTYVPSALTRGCYILRGLEATA